MPKQITITNGPAVVGQGTITRFRTICFAFLGPETQQLTLQELVNCFNAEWQRLGLPQRVQLS